MTTHQPSEKPFSCSHCDKTFVDSESLIKHERTHSSDKPFSCSHCDKEFTTADDLKNHDNKHSDQKAFSCTECDKNFSDSKSLKDHKSTTHSEKNFHIMSWNIRKGLIKHLAEINHVLSEENVGICFLIEVDDSQDNLSNLNTTNPKAFPDYTVHTSKCVAQTDRVRIIVLVHEDISFKIRDDIMSPEAETIWLEISRKYHKNVIVGGIYRQWKNENWNIDEEIDSNIILNQIQKASEENLPMLVAGDMNLDMLKWSEKDYQRKTIADKWKSSISKAGLKWAQLGITYISDAIRNGDHSKSALDHFYSSSDKLFSNFRKINNFMSDHRPILCKIQLKKEKKKAVTRYTLARSWGNFEENAFLHDLINQPWEEKVINPDLNVHQSAQGVEDILTGCVNRHAKLRKIKIRQNFKKGLSVKTKALMSKRNKTFSRGSKCKNLEEKKLLRAQYNKLRNQATSRSRKEGKLSFQNRVKESGNPSEKWKIVREMDSSDNQDQFKLKEKYLYCHKCHTLSDEKPFTCTSCDKEFANPSELNLHQSEHPNENLFSCCQGDKKFKSSLDMDNHQNEHEKPFRCSQCDKTFEGSNDLNDHTSKHQPDENPFRCSTCGKNFAKSVDLNNHESEHHNENTLSCSQCDKKFKTASELNSHQDEHEKPFSCSHCKNTFKCLRELKNHESDEPSCPACDKIIEKFTCSKCDKKFFKSELIEKEKMIESEKELSEIMNKFFPDKVENIEKTIPEYNIDPTSRLKKKLAGKNLHFSLSHVTEVEVRKAIKRLKPKKSSGLDFVPPTIIKLAIDVLTTPLTWVINSSLKSGEFPSCWKSAKVSPIYKNKGSRYSKEFYRPVSNLKAISKVIEDIVNKRVLNFFEKNNLFPQSQHGFRQKRSTFSAVSVMHEKWLQNKESKSHQAIAFLDLSAAFDTLSKDIVCQKLKCFGFDKTSINWFNSYLSDREQRVMIGSTISDPISLKIGSPQGAILSPTIFIILISDMELYCPEAQLCGYADDTSVTVQDKKLNTVKDKCESAVKKLLAYMAINKLSCNDDKTHILVMKHGFLKETLTFNIGEAKIEESKDEKLLGIWVSNDLKWSKHLEKLESKLRSRLYSLRKMEQQVPKSILKDIADSIFVSILRYALGLFCPIRLKQDDPNPTSINGIKVIYNDLLRLLCSSKRDNRKPRKEMLDQVGWLSINQMSCEIRLIEVWKSLHLENYCLKELFEKVTSNQRTRSENKIRLKANFKTRLRESSFHYPSVQVWNSAPLSVTKATSESQARNAIREYVKTLPI